LGMASVAFLTSRLVVVKWMILSANSTSRAQFKTPGIVDSIVTMVLLSKVSTTSNLERASAGPI